MGYSSSLGDGEKVKQLLKGKSPFKLNLKGLFVGLESPTIFGEMEG
jgi:hypothetical protein